MFPATAFDTPTQRKVFRVLAERNRKYTAAELGEMCHRSQPTISRSLSDAKRYSFVDVDTVDGSRKRLYGLDTDSEYVEPIHDFFRIERRRERQGGTVPVDIWNLLEDVTTALVERVDSFAELFLFGSYATGEYYAGSDVDLVFVCRGQIDETREQAIDVLESVVPADETVQLLVAGLDQDEGPKSGNVALERAARRRTSISEGEPMIPLWGSTDDGT